LKARGLYSGKAKSNSHLSRAQFVPNMPCNCISSRVLAPDEAANVLPVWRRSWNRKPSGSPASATHSAQRTDRWKLFLSQRGPLWPFEDQLLRIACGELG
jgi:hypothetical protein